MLTVERKKQLDMDLWIIVIATLFILGIYTLFGQYFNTIAGNASISIVLRVLLIGGVLQFGLAGLGITFVALIRKESFLNYGLRTKGLLKTILLSALCCLPTFLYDFFSGNIDFWLPFSRVNLTKEVLVSGFPSNLLSMLIIALCWGFFEGFNYVVISTKINQRYPSKNRWLNWGAITCAIICILIHGAIGVTPDAIMEMLCTMILIYGMLVVREYTGNAWGCVLIFCLYWNAV